jgi:hypothetical protein
MTSGKVQMSGSNEGETGLATEEEDVLAGLIEAELSKGAIDQMGEEGQGLVDGTSITQQQDQWSKDEGQQQPPEQQQQQQQRKKKSVRHRSKGIVRTSESKGIDRLVNICPGGTMLVVSNYGKELNQEHACR